MLPVYLPVHHFGSLFCWTAWPLIFCHLKCSFLHSQNHLRLRSYLISCIHMKFVLRFWHLLTCTCTWSHTLRDRCCTLERWTAIHRGAWAYGALLKGPQPWQGGELPPLQLSVHQSFLSGESGNRTANLQVIGRPTLTTQPRPPIRLIVKGPELGVKIFINFEELYCPHFLGLFSLICPDYQSGWASDNLTEHMCWLHGLCSSNSAGSLGSALLFVGILLWLTSFQPLNL